MSKKLYRIGITLSFLFPILLLGFIFILWRVYPFGQNSILMADQYTQYIQFYNYLYDALKGKENLLYTWNEGMGLNFWGTFSYYLSSPISLVILMFGKAYLPEAFILMVLLKIGLSGLFMFIYLYPKDNNPKIFNLLIFSISYSLTSYGMGYFFNIMWLDGVYLLPLVLLGIDKLNAERKYITLIIVLSVLFISNFYIAYMVGLFSFLYFLYKNVLLWESKIVFFQKLFTFSLSTLFAAGISAFITLPTFIALRGNSYQKFEWNSFLDPSFETFDFLSKFYNGSVRLFELPNVYSGLLVLLLLPVFFWSSLIKPKEKILSICILFFLFISFQTKGLNLIWHAFSEPSGYLQRFSFTLSFFLLYLSFRMLYIFGSKDIPALMKTYLAHIFLIILLTKLTPELMSATKALFNILLLSFYCLILYVRVNYTRHQIIISFILLMTVCFDIGSNGYNHLKTLYSYPGYNIPREQYNASKSIDGFVEYLNVNDKEFYRTNSLVGQTANDSIRYGYRGMTNFNTLSNGTLHSFMQEIGYSTTLGSRSLTQNQGILTSDALFGFKYMFAREPVSKHGYERVKCGNDGICLYENKNALPIGFLMDPEQINFNNMSKLASENPFQKQNKFIGEPKNYQGDLFEEIDEDSVELSNLEITHSNNGTNIKKINPDNEGYINLTFNLEGEVQFYTLLDAGKGFAGFNETKIFVNEKEFGLYPTFHNEKVLDLGAFKDETVNVRIEFLVAETQLVKQYFYGLNISEYEKRVDEINAQSFRLEKWDQTSVEGNITAQNSTNLFLSIPYDEGWSAKVDGKKVNVEKLGGFIGLPIDKGEHSVSLTYYPRGFISGSIISILSLISFLTFYLWRRKGKLVFKDEK